MVLRILSGHGPTKEARLDVPIRETWSTTGKIGDCSRPTYYNRVTGIFAWAESDARVKTSNKCCNTPVDWATRQPEGQNVTVNPLQQRK